MSPNMSHNPLNMYQNINFRYTISGREIFWYMSNSSFKLEKHDEQTNPERRLWLYG
jgi:hypothetical protein